MILAGDIGGTKTNVAWYQPRDGWLECLGMQSFPSRNYPGLEPILAEFIARHPAPVTAAGFGIAGPVLNGRCETTNLPWVVDTRTLAAELRTDRVWLLNDLESTGYGVAVLRPDELHTVQAGVPRPGHAALIAAGTGLGESLLFWDGAVHIPMPSEGGHADFAPRTPWEIELLQVLAIRYGHVSYERILSGPAFVELYDFVVARGGRPAPEVQAARMSALDPTPIISQAGLERTCPVCAEVLDHFVEIYGAEAGNLALRGLSVAGLFVGGGVAPRILPRLIEGGFLRSFLDKGRFRGLLETIPVHVILNQQTSLLGAARYASIRGMSDGVRAVDGRGPVALS